MRRPRGIHSSKFKSKVALAALNGEETLAEVDNLQYSYMRDTRWSKKQGVVGRRAQGITRVRRIDQKRIGILERIFQDLGYDGDVALIHARVAYFHQVGYLAVGLGESRRRRRDLAALYLDVLLGR